MPLILLKTRTVFLAATIIMAVLDTNSTFAQSGSRTTQISLRVGQRVRFIGENVACLADTVTLIREHSPTAYALYERLVQTGQEGFFNLFLECGSSSYYISLETALHESVHLLDFSGSDAGTRRRTGTFRLNLVDGSIAEIPTTRLMPYGELQSEFTADELEDDLFVNTYIVGVRRSDITSLLSELNAYTHSLSYITSIATLLRPESRMSDRDALLRFMQFTLLYFKVLRETRSETYASVIADTRYALTISTLWNQAKLALQASCAFERLGIDDVTLFPIVFSESLLSELAPFMAEWRGDLTLPYVGGCVPAAVLAPLILSPEEAIPPIGG